VKLDLGPSVQLDEPHVMPQIQLEAFIDERGQRSLAGHLRRAGRVGKCLFLELRVSVVERLDCGGWLAVSVDRRVKQGGPWLSLTPAAEFELRDAVDKATASISFHDAWFTSFHQVNAVRLYEQAGQAMAVAAWERAWWARSHVIAAMMVDGKVTAELVDDRELRVECPSRRRDNLHSERERALLALRRFDTSELVGYFTSSGRIAPTGVPDRP
jgi:hypothetical protein